MGEDDQRRLRTVMREAVRASRSPARQLERKIGLGNGNLERLLDGRLVIRVHHLVALARTLGVPPADFLELGFPEAAASAPHRLRDYLAPPETPPAAATPLDEIVRAVVREELARQRAETAPAE